MEQETSRIVKGLLSDDRMKKLATLKSFNRRMMNCGHLYVSPPLLDALKHLLLVQEVSVAADWTCTRLALLCLGHLLYKSGSNIPHHVYKSFLLQIYDLMEVCLHGDGNRRLFLSCLKACQLILGESRQAIDSSLMSNILRCVCKFLFVIEYGNWSGPSDCSSTDYSSSSSDSHFVRGASGRVATTSLESLQVQSLQFIANLSAIHKHFVPYFHLLYSEYAPFSPAFFVCSETHSPSTIIQSAQTIRTVLQNTFKYLSLATLISSSTSDKHQHQSQNSQEGVGARRPAFSSHGEKLALSLIWLHRKVFTALHSTSSALNAAKIHSEMFQVLADLIRVTPYDRICGSVDLLEVEICHKLLLVNGKLLSEFPVECLKVISALFQKGLLCDKFAFDDLFNQVCAKCPSETLNCLSFNPLFVQQHSSVLIDELIRLMDASLLDSSYMDALLNINRNVSDNDSLTRSWSDHYLKIMDYFWSRKEYDVYCKLSEHIDSQQTNHLAIYQNLFSIVQESPSSKYEKDLMSLAVKALGVLCSNKKFKEEHTDQLLECCRILTDAVHGWFTAGPNDELVKWSLWTIANISDNLDLLKSSSLSNTLNLCRALADLKRIYGAREAFYVSGLRILCNVKSSQKGSYDDDIDEEFIRNCFASKSPKVLWNTCRTVKSVGVVSRFNDVIQDILTNSSNDKVRQAARNTLADQEVIE